MDKVKLLIKQWWCDHNSRETTHSVVCRCVMTVTKCLDCGKQVPRSQREMSNDNTAIELLHTQFGDR